MSADAAESKKSSSAILPIAGALFLGIVIGAAMNSGDDAALKVKRDLEARVEAAESAVADAIAEAEAAAEAGAAAAAESAAATVSEVQGKLEEVAAAAAESGDADELAALSSRVQVLAEQMAAMVTAPRSGAGASAPPAAPAPAEKSAEADSGGDAAALASAIGDNGLTLAVGQTGAVDGARIFMSRIDTEAGSARLMVVGEGPTMIGGSEGSVTLANGCELKLEGVADRRAYISVACGG